MAEGTRLPDCVALIVASGRGLRFGDAARPKQYQPLAGRAVLHHCLERFCRHPRVDAVRAVIQPEDRALYDRAADGLELLAPAAGGATRQESVRRGLESLQAAAPAVVLIHDGVRPLVDAALIDRVIEGLVEHVAVLPALPVTDTLKRVADDRVLGTVERDGLFRAQTPQGFRYPEILDAHRRQAGTAMTDDVALAEAAGLAVAVVAGDEQNLKITAPEDLGRAERLLGGGLVARTGLGFDVHRLAPGEGLVLAGVRLPEPLRLIGHSDADVGLHALTDALLGTLGAGDIGSHFPPSDPRWKGADSTLFLAHARALIEAAGGRIEHVDLTLICERPRIGPYRAAMVARLQELLALGPGRVSVKATTTEQLGFTGRGEGIAAQAVATVSLPGS
jgi:2-C-methyl-D-erythritol 4-phosphate cytidylyltransferase / 2-C-methyl-D-erythritol 2,4-cyclodiphosphate synthase